MKTMMQTKLNKIATLFLVAVMCLGIAVPYLAAPEDKDVIYISTAEDLIELSENCGYDKWSVGKTIILSNDISLKDAEYEPIPYFAGTFDGQGYTISDLELDGSYEPTGLFGTTAPGALICNLNVTGSVIPEGSKESVGGIVGENNGTLQNVSFSGVVSGEVAVGAIVGLNKETGIIENATSQGHVFGEHGTGGIAGRNLGKILASENEALVNNSSVDSTISLEDIDTNLIQSLYSMNSSDAMNTFTDTGGIAGYSSGMIIDCKNEGVIGYPHVGYNAGGIAGRNTGYIQACENAGEILGRKDIGGIVGQVEPFLDSKVNESDLAVVDKELNTLQNQVDSTIDSTENTTNGVDQNLDNISKYIEDASDALEGLSNTVTNETETKELTNNEEVGDIVWPEDVEWPESSDEVEIPENIENIDTSNWNVDTSSAKSELTKLSDSLNGISEELRSANSKVEDGSNELTDNLKSINNQLGNVSDSVMTMIDNAQNFTLDDVITDTSDVSVEDITYGKIVDCINKGTIEGDINIGGIAGIMSIEYEVDPEDDTSVDISWEERKQYEVKAVIFQCVNKGEVIAKKDNTAGICGQLDIGVIANCLSYGDVTSESGAYVGGIAGVANSIIKNCVVNCGLSGDSYVGGIIGCGYIEEDNGSTVSNCYSMVKIIDCEQFEGAIAGCEDGFFENNYFVSSELQGMNRISYAGMAQPITYEELLEIPNIPDELKSFTLSFVAEDKVIKSVEFNYGDSFDEEIIPEVPSKDGYDGVWDITDVSNLCFDTVVTAEYTLYVTALQSNITRENGRPVFLVEGDFSNEDFLVAIEGLAQGLQDEIAFGGEYWSVSFSDDGQKRHSVRFLPAEDLENARIFIREEGKWKRADVEDFGSYKTFQITGTELELVVVPIRYEVLFYIILLFLLIPWIVGIVILERKKHFISNSVKAIIKKFGVKKLIIFLVALGVIGGIAGTVYVAMLPQVRTSAELAALSADIIATEKQSMKVDLTADVGSNHIELDSKLYMLNENDISIFVLEENGHAIYLAGEGVYLENGKGYHIGEAATNENSLLGQIRKLYEATDITRTEELDKVVYSITATGENAKDLMEVFVPSTEGQIAEAGDVIVRIIAKDGIFQKVEVEGSAVLKNASETEISVSAIISDFSELEAGEYEIPEIVRNAIEASDAQSLPTMEEEMYRLMLAWIEFTGEKQDGTVAIDVSCGPINLETEYDWSDIAKGVSESSNASNIEILPDMVYEICMNGEFDCEKLGDSYIFQLELDEETMTNLAEIISPEIKSQVVDLTEGSVDVVVENNEISSFEIVIDGTVTVLLSEVDASVKAEFVFQ